MPEDADVPTEKVHESIHEELERAGGRFLRQIALTTAILAACAAVVALQAGSTVNEALVLKTEATRLQGEASDQWAYYQAKGIKAAVADASRTSWLAIGKQPPPGYVESQARELREQAQVQKAAEEKQRQRDEKEREADVLLRRHHGYANAVALFQVAIALGAVAALTRNRLVWLGSDAVGIAGIALGLFTAFR